MKSNINSQFIGRLLVALLAIAISLGAPHAFAGDAEDKTKAADKATGEAEKAKSDYDKAAAAEKAYEDAEKAAEAAEDEVDKAKDALKKAEEDLKAAKNSGDEDKINKAQKDRNEKDQAVKDADTEKGKAQGERDTAQKDADKDNLDALRKAKRKARKAARDAIKKAKDAIDKMDKTNPGKDKLKEDLDKIKDRLALAPQPAGSATLATLSASGKVQADIAGTGETIGHIADLKIQNLTDQPLTCAIPSMILESSNGRNQHYACPRGQTVTLDPHQTKTVPMNGVCLNRNKPPVAKGVSGDLVVNEANPAAPQNPNSHFPPTDAGKLLRSCAAKYTAADQLQKSGALKNLPYHDPQKQKDIVVQWSTWTDPVICQMTGSPPATKEDLRKVVYKQVEQQGPMSPEKKKKVDQGIDTIFEKVELTTAKAKELEKAEEEIPAVAGATVKETPSAGQPVSAPTAAPGESVAATPTASPQGPGTTTTQPTATPTPCKDDPLALPRAKDLVDKAVKACTDLDRLDHEAGEAEDAADADDATPDGKEAKAKADKAAADAKAAKEIADQADASAKAAGKAKAKDAKAKARDAEDKRKKAEAADKAAEAAKSPLRKKADEARKKVIEAVGAKWDAQREAKDAIKKLKCPENIDKLTKQLEEACGK